MMGSGSKCRVLVGSCIQRCKGTSVYNSRVPVEIWPGLSYTYTCKIIALFIHCNEAMKIQKSLQLCNEFAMKEKDSFSFKKA